MSHEPAFILDQVSCIPHDFADVLRSYEDLSRRHNVIDELLEEPGFFRIATDLEAVIRGSQVHAYHCTKQPYAGFFESRGLRLLSTKQHLDEFDRFIADKVGHDVRMRFSQTHADWQSSPKQFTRGREGRVWVCLSRHLIETGDTWRFFTYYGGETVYWSIIERDQECEAVLANIGEGVVVEIKVLGQEFDVFHDLGFARDLLSHWALTHNSSFQISSLEASLTRNVAPGELVAVHAANTFCPGALMLESGRSS